MKLTATTSAVILKTAALLRPPLSATGRFSSVCILYVYIYIAYGGADC